MKNRISMTEMFRGNMILKKSGDPATLMGTGPMSYEFIKAQLLNAMERDYPVYFIASRNQVDSDSFGHGYVRGWDQNRFIKDVDAVAEEIGFNGLCYISRDHGGPWQRDEERRAKLPTEEAMALGNRSYVDDMKAGFDLLHIDPTKDPHIPGTVPLSVVLDRTIDIIEYLEKVRREEGLGEVAYEVGTEETNGGLTSQNAFEEFITELIRRLDEKRLPRPLFVVGQTGTLTRLTENIGHYDRDFAVKLSEIAEKFGVGLKQHNSDYLSDALLLEHRFLGVTAANIAPEFGVIQTRAYLELHRAEKDLCGDKASDLKNVMTDAAVKCGRWRKWMVDPKIETMSHEEILADADLAEVITENSGHYTYEDPAVRAEINKMTANLKEKYIDVGEYAVKKLWDSVDRYSYCFNLWGRTGKILRTVGK